MSLAGWCVLGAALMPYVFAGIAKWDSNFDNARPRTFLAALEGYQQRAHWAQLNSFEAFPAFAVAVLLAQQTQAAQPTVDALAFAFVALRVVYGACYLADWPTARSIVWIAAVGCVVALFLTAA